MADRQALIATVRAAFKPVRDSADSVGDDTLRAEIEQAANTLERAINDWAGPLQQRIGTDPAHGESWWIGVGQDLLTQIGRYVRDNTDSAAQYSRLARVLGDGAQWLEGEKDKAIGWARGKVDTLKGQLAELQGKAQELDTQRQLLQASHDDLPADAQDLLFGAAAHTAETNLQRLADLVTGLDEALHLVETGQADAVKTGNDWALSDPPTQSGLGWVPAILASAGATMIAIIAICGTIAAGLYVYYQHANEVLHAQIVQQGAGLVSQGKLTPAQLQALLDSYDKLNKPPPSSGSGWGWALFALAVAGGGGGYAYYRWKKKKRGGR